MTSGEDARANSERPPFLPAQADRNEPYTHITPFQEQKDTSVECVGGPSFPRRGRTPRRRAP